MMEVYPLFRTQAGLFKNDSFDPVWEQNTLFFEEQSKPGCEDWRFTEYSPERVAHLFHNWKKCAAAPEVHLGVKQAYEQELSLLEICTGNYDDPDYIPITADLDIGTLKRQWHQDYWLYHHIFIGKEFERAYADRSASIPGPMGRPADE